MNNLSLPEQYEYLNQSEQSLQLPQNDNSSKITIVRMESSNIVSETLDDSKKEFFFNFS